ncbi:hypothetical protein HYE67_005223 [Fusarium culmorum]|uniref:Uncharacterized protein n=1 Tax=Fusarium culmorum TaxID=5516 RepID=A0A2T4GY77_FUSCU|nr:hypothetical protein FCULG_00012456 [Fusarium culmorum]QPC62992.1 hypothetical protein HYE67_005223 [Fusarium culmorum]
METPTTDFTTDPTALVSNLSCSNVEGMCFGTIEIKRNYEANGDFRQLEACKKDSACKYFIFE